MTNPQQTQMVDSDLPFYCAFSFPAVLKTLGPDQWDMLKPTFDLLVGDVQVREREGEGEREGGRERERERERVETLFSLQWKIRRVLAYSLHDIARILGQERTCSDLLSVLDEYTTKDVDDVKLGVLTHLVELLEVSSFTSLLVSHVSHMTVQSHVTQVT